LRELMESMFAAMAISGTSPMPLPTASGGLVPPRRAVDHHALPDHARAALSPSGVTDRTGELAIKVSQTSTTRIIGTFLLMFLVPVSAPRSVSAEQAIGGAARSATWPFPWETLRPGRQWVGGIAPVYDHQFGCHVCRLVTGDSTLFKVPPGAIVRLLNPCGPLRNSDIAIWTSNGSGLYCRQVGMPGSAGRCLFVETSDAHVSLMRIDCLRANHTITREVSHRRNAKSYEQRIGPAQRNRCAPLAIAVSVSRNDTHQAVGGRPCTFAGCGHTVRLSRSPHGPGTLHYLLPSRRPVVVDVGQCARLRIETRLQYPDGAGQNRQTYKLAIAANGMTFRRIEFETTSEFRRMVYVDGCARVVGQRRFALLDIQPGCAEVTITSSADLYVRLLEVGDEAYRWPDLNGPTIGPDPLQQLADRFTPISLWNLAVQGAGGPTNVSHHSNPLFRDVVMLAARDNRYRGGGLRAAMRARIAANAYRGNPRVRQFSDQLLGFHTFYRNLLPVTFPGVIEPHTAWFSTRRLRDPEESTVDATIGSQLIDDSLHAVTQARFLRMDVGQGAPAEYRLPPELGLSLLRVVIDQSSVQQPARLMVQFDDILPRMIEVTPDRPVACREFLPSRADTALAGLHWRFPTADAGTLGGPFRRRGTPAPSVPVATAELVIPEGTQTVRVWSMSRAAVDLALQYRAARSFRLSERAYRDAVCRVRSSGQLLLDMLLTGATGDDSNAMAELRNHWWPLIRRLRADDKSWRSGVVRHPLPAATMPAAQTPSPQWALDAVQMARHEMVEHRWLSSVESWTRALPALGGSDRAEALLGRARALDQLPESHLAEVELRGLALLEKDPIVRAAAQQTYVRRSRRRGEMFALERAEASAVLRGCNPEDCLALADVLISDGRAGDALLLASACDGDVPRNRETLLRAAYQLGWWKTFDAAIEQLAPGERRQFWKGIRCVRRGDWQAADRHFAASSRGAAMRTRIAEGRDILRRIQSANLTTRVSGVFDWERWQSDAPGPWMWRQEPDLVQSCPTTAAVYSRTSNLVAQYYGADPDVPAELSVQGPVMLRIDARPLHTRATDQAIDDWIVVQGEGRNWLTPVSGNRVAPDLTVIGSSDTVPGERCRIEMRLGPGHHRIQVAAESSQLLVQAYLARPELALPVLPPITRGTLQAVLSGTFGHAGVPNAEATTQPAGWGHPLSSVQIVGASYGCKPARAPLWTAPLCAKGQAAVQLDRLTAIDASRLAMRLGTVNSRDVIRLLAWARTAGSGCRAAERSEITARYGDIHADRETVSAELGNRPTGRGPASGRTSSTRPLDRFDSTRQAGRDAIRQQMNKLAYQAEHEPAERVGCAAKALEIVHGHPDIPRLDELVTRILRDGEWIPYQQFRSSAGVHGVNLEHWSPESPRLRVRKAVMRSDSLADYMVSGDKRLLLRVENALPTEYRAVLEMAQISYLDQPALHIRWQIDNGTVRSVQLDNSGDRKTVRLAIDPGKHTFQLWIDHPFANQWALVTLYQRQGGEPGRVPGNDPVRGTSERGGAAGPPPARGQSPEARSRPADRLTRVFNRQRLYQVATYRQPVVFSVQGPTVLRIDEKVPHGVHSRTVAVTESQRTFTFRPQQVDGIRLLRVSQLDFHGTRRPPPTFRPLVRIDPVWEPWLSTWSTEQFGAGLDGEMGDEVQAGSPTCCGTPPIGGGHASPWEIPNWPDDATWSVAAGWVDRRNLQEFSVSSARDRFAQIDASRYAYNPWTGSFGRRNLITRVRASAGATVGLVDDQWWSLSPGMFVPILHGTRSGLAVREPLGLGSIRLHTRGSFYLQQPGQPIAPAGNELEWSAAIQVRLSQHRDLTLRTYHIPSARVLGRWLSMKRNQYSPGQVDQDIFTRYKRNHPTGLRLADTFTYQPTLDTRWWVRPRLFTNEDFDLSRPDNVSIRLGHSQLIGPLQYDLSYRVTQYYRDRDRRRNSTQQVLYFDAIFEQWRSARSQWEVHGGVRHDTSSGGTTAFVRFEVFRSHGRGYRDRYPASTGFLNLRKQRQYEVSDW